MIELCQIDNILDKFRHAGGFAANLRCEWLDVFRFDHSVFEELCIPGNRVQRCFHLVRYIRGKLLADQGGFFNLRLVFF